MVVPIVTIEEGQLRGKVCEDRNGGLFFSFQGIPYAKPPLGELRFKAPRPPEPWVGIRDATAEGNDCYSRHIFFNYIVGSEDCLFLNVYTPKLPEQNEILKPVMVWIHGGGFMSGSGNTELYGPEFLIPEDVVLVTINYRLGLLGFLCMDDPSLGVPGNAGLKDQVMALKWVQRNISKFNGDPNNVTIFGESAGAVSVHYLMLSPMAKGLFHKAIAQSGCALHLWARGQRSASVIAKALKLDAEDERVIFKMLQEMPVEQLLEIQSKIPNTFVVHIIRSIGIVVEKPSNEPPFLLEEPMDLLKSGRFTQVPFLAGFNSREGMLWEIIHKGKYGKVKLPENYEMTVPSLLKLPKGGAKSKAVAERIRVFYNDEEEPTVENNYLLQTDNFILRELNTVVKFHTALSKFPVYFYRMSVESDLNIYKKIGKIRNSGVCHGDDLGYIFKNFATPEIRPSGVEDITIKRFTKLWATFARTGDPIPVEKDVLINVTWKPTEKGKLHFLNIGENLTVGVNPEAERMAFWDDIFDMCGINSKL